MDKELPMPTRQKVLYDNWKVYSHNDKLMFCCSKYVRYFDDGRAHSQSSPRDS